MNAWRTQVSKTMKAEKGKKASMGAKWFPHVLKTAKSLYHKNKKGGGDDPVDTGSSSGEETKAPLMGGRRRSSKKTRRHGRR